MFLSLKLLVKTSPSVNNCGLQMLANAATYLAYSCSSKQHGQATFPYSLHCHTDIEVNWDNFEERHSLVCLVAR